MKPHRIQATVRSLQGITYRYGPEDGSLAVPHATAVVSFSAPETVDLQVSSSMVCPYTGNLCIESSAMHLDHSEMCTEPEACCLKANWYQDGNQSHLIVMRNAGEGDMNTTLSTTSSNSTCESTESEPESPEAEKPAIIELFVRLKSDVVSPSEDIWQGVGYLVLSGNETGTRNVEVVLEPPTSVDPADGSPDLSLSSKARLQLALSVDHNVKVSRNSPVRRKLSDHADLLKRKMADNERITKEHLLAKRTIPTGRPTTAPPPKRNFCFGQWEQIINMLSEAMSRCDGGTMVGHSGGASMASTIETRKSLQI